MKGTDSGASTIYLEKLESDRRFAKALADALRLYSKKESSKLRAKPKKRV